MKLGPVAFFALLASSVCATLEAAEWIYATSGTNLTRFPADKPSATSAIPVTGMQPGETLVGIDLRPFTGQLYGIGSTSRLYTIDPATGTATQLGVAGSFTLAGTLFGMDFNPTVDRIREVSNTDQNQRINPITGALAATDTSLNPSSSSIVAAAYTNNDSDPTTPTTLYAISSTTGQLVRIGGIDGAPSANGGVVTPIGSVGLGTSLDGRIGFDVSGLTGAAYATITVGGVSALYTIDLATGAASHVGTIGNGATPYLGATASGVENQPPAITVFGRKKVTTSRERIRLRGRATDDSAVAKVEYRAGKGRFRKAKGTSSWSFTIRLDKPVTRVSVRAVDDTGLMSPAARVVVRKTR
jgi:hypothetical protein